MSKRELKPAGPVPASISHIVLRTAHLDEAIDWYGKVLGMHANYRSQGGAALSNDSEHHRIALASVAPGERASSMSPGLEHFAFKIPGLPDLLANYLRLAELGIKPLICINHTGTVSFYYQDPDGVQVELFIDALAADAAVKYMGSPEFVANPIGCPFDPEDMVQRYREGAPIAELLQPPPFEPSLLEPFFRARSGAAAQAG